MRSEAPLEYDYIGIGEVAYLKGITSGIPAEAGDVIRQSGCLPKAPITTPQVLAPVHYHNHRIRVERKPAAPVEKALVGTDAFVCRDEPGRNPDVLGARLEAAVPEGLSLSLVTNRGVKVYPDGMPETFCTHHWRCRFRATDETVPYETVVQLLADLNAAGIEVIKTENLYTFDGKPGFLMGQGE